MAETVQLPVTTTVTTNAGRISIYTFYVGGEEGLQGIVNAFIANSNGASGLVTYLQGELVVILRYEDNSTVVEINNSGELIITSSDSDKYSINSDGYLIFNNI